MMLPPVGFMDTPLAALAWTGIHMSPWKLIGLIGALMFGGRWLVQFIASRRHGKPVIQMPGVGMAAMAGCCPATR